MKRFEPDKPTQAKYEICKSMGFFFLFIQQIGMRLRAHTFSKGVPPYPKGCHLFRRGVTLMKDCNFPNRCVVPNRVKMKSHMYQSHNYKIDKKQMEQCETNWLNSWP